MIDTSIKILNQPCNCDPKYIYDHSEFGLPLGCNTYCSKCKSIWNKPINHMLLMGVLNNE
jgi:hypothetical protein